jgi:uncharacterized membrane protein
MLPAAPPPPDKVVAAVQRTIQAIHATSFEGPIPPPGALEHYERVQPGLANRIVVMAEQQVSMAQEQMRHRHGLETAVINNDIRLARRGQVMGYSFGMGSLAFAAVLAYIGAEMSSVATVLGAIGTIIATFVYAGKKRDEELEAKKPTDLVPRREP